MSRVADDFYLIAHEGRSGRCRVPLRTVGVGLAAGLLSELVLAGHLRVLDGCVYPRVGPVPPGDRVAREVLHTVCSSRVARSVGEWLALLGSTAVRDVRARLTADGVLAVMQARSAFGRRRRLVVATDPNAAVWPGIRLANVLSRGEPMSPSDMVLSGLVQVTGLLGDVLWLKPDHVPGYARAVWVRESLPAELAVLLAHADAAVGAGVLAGRGT